MLEIIKLLLSRWDQATEIIETPGGVLASVREGVRLSPAPVGRPSAPARLHTFQDVPSFAAWLLKHATPQAEILADFGEGIAALPAQQWGGDLIRCKPVAHPAWVALDRLSGAPLRQPQFYQELLKLQPYLKDPGVLGKVASLEVKTSGKIVANVDPSTGATKLVSVEKDTSYPVNLPAEIVFSLPLHIGGEPVEVRVALLPAVTDAGLTLQATIKERDLVLLAAWESQVDGLRKALGSEWLVGLGKLTVAQ